MTREAQLGFLAHALAGQQGIRVGGALMGGIGAPVSVVVDGRVAGIIRWGRGRRRVLRLDALERGPRLDQGPIHGEVLIGEQPFSAGILDHGIKELLGGLVDEQPRTVLAEGAVIEDGLIKAHVQKPAEQDVVVHHLAEDPMAPNGEQRDQ